MENMSTIVAFALFILAAYCLRSLIMGGGAYYILYKSPAKNWNKIKAMKLNPKVPSPKIVKKEFQYTMLYSFYYMVWDTLAFTFFLNGKTFIYTDVDKYGIWYLPISFLLLILINDTYFYWTHRLAHSKYGKWMNHSVHHQSHNPTPWAGLSASSAESNVLILFHLFIVFILPMHTYVIVGYFFYSYFANVLGHSGFELSPYKTKTLNNATNHYLHHKFFDYNYSLYFQHWDRWMGTEYKNAEK